MKRYEQPAYIVRSLRDGWPSTMTRYAGLCGCGCGRRLLATYNVVKRGNRLYAPEHDPDPRCVRCGFPGDVFCEGCQTLAFAFNRLTENLSAPYRFESAPRGFRKDGERVVRERSHEQAMRGLGRIL